MMSLNKNVGALAIFYLCSTSKLLLALLMTLGSITATASSTLVVTKSSITPSPAMVVNAVDALQGTSLNASSNMHNSNEMQVNATNEEKSNNLSHFEKNNRNDNSSSSSSSSTMALSPSLSSPSRDWNNEHHQQQYLDQHSFEMENSRKYLHLDEHNLVATTPKIHTTKLPNRYEQGLEDYEEAVARVDRIKEEQQKQQAFGMNGLETVLTLIETVSNVWNKVSTEFEQKQSTITDKSNDRPTNDIDGNDKSVGEVSLTDVAEGRYIKGDPLKGYYDFIITEGSYKFWAGFQLFTAGLMIYSTFAAIYYSKVNPVVGDYDYTSYLGGGRSMADDPEPLPSSSSPLSELANSYIFQTAAHGFQFVLDAIEKIPKTTTKSR